MTLKDLLREILSRIEGYLDEIDENQVRRLVEEIEKARRIYVCASGTTRFVGENLVMRLVQLGYDSRFLEPSTESPEFSEKDLLIAISGTGEASPVVTAARLAKESGSRLAVMTSFPDSTLGKMADILVRVGGRVKLPEDKDFRILWLEGIFPDLAPEGELFEMVSFMLVEGLASLLAKRGQD